MTWTTHHWPCRVFCFLLGITEINIYLAKKYFVWSKKEVPTLLDFRRALAHALIFNELLQQEQHGDQKRKSRCKRVHTICTAPTHARRFKNGKWKKSAKAKYQQYTCRGLGCKKKCRTYCSCTVGHWLCKSCHMDHVVEEATAVSTYLFNSMD